MTSSSPLVVTSSRLRYHALRGLRRNFSCVFPCRRSQVHLTSAAVNRLPSCHLTPCRSLKVSSLPSSLQVQLSARSGTIVSSVFFSLCWSNSTRLLNTGISTVIAARVTSSWIDIEAGLAKSGILRMPPDFCANASWPPSQSADTVAAATAILREHLITALQGVGGPRCDSRLCP